MSDGNKDSIARTENPLLSNDNAEILLDSVEDGATRSRIILLIVIVSCFITLINFYHSRQNTWAKDMVKTVHYGESYIRFNSNDLVQDVNSVIDTTESFVRGFYEEVKFESGPNEGLKLSESVEWPSWVSLNDPFCYLYKLSTADSLSKKGLDSLNTLCQTIAYVAYHNMRSQEALRLENLNIIEEVKKRKVVDIPFFGGWFYINDIGVFSGVSFVIVLLLLSINFFTERSNMKMFFQSIRINPTTLELTPWNTLKDNFQTRHFFIFMYNLAVSKQLFTVPFTYFNKYNMDDTTMDNKKFINVSWKFKRLTITLYRSIAVLITCLPFFTYYSLKSHDVSTFLIGWLKSPKSSELAFSIEGVLFYLILGLTLTALIAWSVLHFSFDRFFINLLKISKSTQDQGDQKYNEVNLVMWRINFISIVIGVGILFFAFYSYLDFYIELLFYSLLIIFFSGFIIFIIAWINTDEAKNGLYYIIDWYKKMFKNFKYSG